jgi:hypothetical protein
MDFGRRLILRHDCPIWANQDAKVLPHQPSPSRSVEASLPPARGNGHLQVPYQGRRGQKIVNNGVLSIVSDNCTYLDNTLSGITSPPILCLYLCFFLCFLFVFYNRKPSFIPPVFLSSHAENSKSREIKKIPIKTFMALK